MLAAGNSRRRPMASVRTTPPAGAATPPGRPRAGWGDDLAAALLGTWVVGGLFLDGWAHLNQPGLETFFSQWHAVFYLGFAVSTVVLARLVARHQRGRFDPALGAAGYGLGVGGGVRPRPGAVRLRPRAGRGGAVRGRRGRRRRLAHHVRGRDGRGRTAQPLPPAAARRRPADGDQPGPLGLDGARPARPLPGPVPAARPVD